MKEIILVYVVSLVNLLFLFLVFVAGIKTGQKCIESRQKPIQNIKENIDISEDEMEDELEKHFGNTEEKKKATDIILSNIDKYDGDEQGNGQEDIPI